MSSRVSTQLSRSGIHDARRARSLGAIAEHKLPAGTVRKRDLAFGDRVIVTTRNSVYSLWSLDRDLFAVSGGWFDRHGDAPRTLGINGCTYGGSLIRQDVVAAPGLFLEFDNGVSTTRIREVSVMRWRGAAEAGTPDLQSC